MHSSFPDQADSTPERAGCLCSAGGGIFRLEPGGVPRAERQSTTRGLTHLGLATCSHTKWLGNKL